MSLVNCVTTVSWQGCDSDQNRYHSFKKPSKAYTLITLTSVELFPRMCRNVVSRTITSLDGHRASHWSWNSYHNHDNRWHRRWGTRYVTSGGSEMTAWNKLKLVSSCSHCDVKFVRLIFTTVSLIENEWECSRPLQTLSKRAKLLLEKNESSVL